MLGCFLRLLIPNRRRLTNWSVWDLQRTFQFQEVWISFPHNQVKASRRQVSTLVPYLVRALLPHLLHVSHSVRTAPCRDRSECEHALALLTLGRSGSQGGVLKRHEGIILRASNRLRWHVTRDLKISRRRGETASHCPLAKKSCHYGTARHQGDGANTVD